MKRCKKVGERWVKFCELLHGTLFFILFPGIQSLSYRSEPEKLLIFDTE